MASENTLAFTDDNFDAEVLSSDVPVLVDFWAEWCQPCKMLGPTIDEVAGDYKGRAKVGKLNTDESRQVAVKFGITAIPTVMIFSDGELKKTLVGMNSKDKYMPKHSMSSFLLQHEPLADTSQ